MMRMGQLRACEGGKQWKILCAFLCVYSIFESTHLFFFPVCTHTHTHAYESTSMCVFGHKQDRLQLLLLSPSLNGLLMESNEGVFSWQMCPLCNSVLPRDCKTDPSETSVGKQPLHAQIKLCVCCGNLNGLFANFASCCCTPGSKSKYHFDIAPRVTLNDKSPGSVSQAQNLLEAHLLHWSVKLF